MNSILTFTEPKTIPKQYTWLWHPNLIVFVSSGCIMVLELVAGRIIAPQVGVSLYTWTSVIGVILAGISLGNYIGGRLADRCASLRLLGGIFISGGIASLLVLGIDKLHIIGLVEWPYILEILILITVLFFLPSTILGTISPIVTKLAVRDLTRTGNTVGKIYAAGALGSIVGTFATGFLFISWFGTHFIIFGIGLTLTVLGLLFLLAGRWALMVIAVLLLVRGSALSFQQGWLCSSCTRETNYFCIQVKEDEHEGKPILILYLDRLIQSYTFLNDPTKFVYDYLKMFSEVTAYQAQRMDHLRTLFIGGGGYTFPQYMEAVYPQSELHVIEIDPVVTEVAHDMLGLSRDTKIVTYNEDARVFLKREPKGEFDLIIGDAFNDFSVPFHLTTREFNGHVREWLADNGIYMVNIIDGARGLFIRSFTNTLRQTFNHVYIALDIETWRKSRSTYVVIASDSPLDLITFAEFSDHNELHKFRLLNEEKTEILMNEERTVTLTDRHAPVDQMLIPLLIER
ncbi:MAG: fused MFS/spermidine synthase [Calditrichaeota bacterium]|nr:fused MFS/spermidine synthase [Calditrichota bacterium]